MTEDALDLYILNSGVKNKAIVVGRRGQDIAIEGVSLGSNASALASFSDRIESIVVRGSIRPSVVELRDIGQRLFDFLFKGELLDLYNRAAPNRITLQIVSVNQIIHRMPWEFLHPRDIPAVPNHNRSVVRILPMCAPPIPARTKISGKLRVLLAVADPIDQAGVGWSDVEANVRRPMEAQLSPVATLKIIPAASSVALLHALNTESFDVFHFLGHGSVGADGIGRLNLVDIDTKASDVVLAPALAAVLSGQQLKLCILSACLTGAGMTGDPFGSVATTLLRSGIPAVVANQTSIPTKSVAPFVGALYSRLLRDGNIDAAVMAGRHALQGDLRVGIPADSAVVEWGIPSLFRLPGNGQLFDT